MKKTNKEGTCKVLGRSIVFSAFYAAFCFCSKLVIITTLRWMGIHRRVDQQINKGKSLL